MLLLSVIIALVFGQEMISVDLPASVDLLPTPAILIGGSGVYGSKKEIGG